MRWACTFSTQHFQARKLAARLLASQLLATIKARYYDDYTCHATIADCSQVSRLATMPLADAFIGHYHFDISSNAIQPLLKFPALPGFRQRLIFN